MHVQGQEPLTASMLAAAPPQEQKQMIGGCHGCCAGVGSAVRLCVHERACGLGCTRESVAARRSCGTVWDCSEMLLKKPKLNINEFRLC